jgi:hypothetical protein
MFITTTSRGARMLRLSSAAVLLGTATVAAAAAPASAADDTTPPDLVAAPWDTPAVSLTAEDHWFTGPATFHLHAEDASGVTIAYRISHGAKIVDSGSQTSDSGLSVFPQITLEGESWLIYNAIDAFGNSTGDRVMHVVVDTTAPSIEVSSPTMPADARYAFGELVPLSASCVDQFGTMCTLPDGSPLPANLPTDAAGPHEFTIRARDLVGHETVVTLRYTVDAPVATEEPDVPDPVDPAVDPVSAPAAPAAPDAPTLAYTGLEDSWPFAVAALALVAVGALLVHRASRRSRTTTGSDAAELAEGSLS